MLSQEEDVGEKWPWKRGCFSSHSLTLGWLCVAKVVADQMQFLVLGRLPVDMAREIDPFDMTVTLGTAGDPVRPRSPAFPWSNDSICSHWSSRNNNLGILSSSKRQNVNTIAGW